MLAAMKPEGQFENSPCKRLRQQKPLIWSVLHPGSGVVSSSDDTGLHGLGTRANKGETATKMKHHLCQSQPYALTIWIRKPGRARGFFAQSTCLLGL